MKWLSYNELAWVEHFIVPPEKHENEASTYIEVLKKYIDEYPAKMLHLGCGAGGHDFHFKEYFRITGVDMSEGMLELARNTNPEITYIKGDMRTIRLKEKFDVVIIPDSIMYMTSIAALKETIGNAVLHMKPDGVLLVVNPIKEEFKANNFVYTGEKDDVHVTVFENNYVVSESTYEAVMIYLIRQNGILNVYHEVHTLGLFSNEVWEEIFEENHLKITEMNMDQLYDPYLLQGGEYKMKIFTGVLDTEKSE